MNEYLNYELLNEIENKIENLHNKFKNKFYLTETYLRNIKIDDDLSERILYLSFPREIYQDIDDDGSKKKSFVFTDNGGYICHKTRSTNDFKYIAYDYNGYHNLLYSKRNNELNNYYNYIRYKLPYKYGIVISIDENDTIYKKIKIKNSKDMLLEYNKKEWIINEIPYLQYIDNIEEGINNVAEFFYKPAGYIYKEWTTTGHYNIAKSDCGLAQKPISINDIERWNKNIELLEKAFNSFFNVWNVVSYINWNENSQFEWEEY